MKSINNLIIKSDLSTYLNTKAFWSLGNTADHCVAIYAAFCARHAPELTLLSKLGINYVLNDPLQIQFVCQTCF